MRLTESVETFCYPGGISTSSKNWSTIGLLIDAQPFYYSYKNDLQVEIAMAWTEQTSHRILSFVNSIPTPNGGTHDTAFRNGITRAVRAYIEKRNGLSKGLKGISAEDVREGLQAIISVYLHGNLEFQGQTKERLTSETAQQVEPLVRNALETWLH